MPFSGSRARVAALVAISLTACSQTPAPRGATTPARNDVDKPTPTQKPTNPCLVKWSMDHHDSVLREQRSVGPRMDDFPTRFAAATIDASAQTPVSAVASFRVSDRPMLWFTGDKAGVVVDDSSFSDLTVADPTRMGVGDRAAIGRVLRDERELPGRALLEFLIRAGVIATYWHIGSEMCLESETGEGMAYSAVVRGEHTYFTNEENVDPFAFRFTRGDDGALAVEGLE